ncbi:cysteine protease [Fragilaria crotonensis]|nr:cysteine protease [Fragilaria crotonensis]
MEEIQSRHKKEIKVLDGEKRSAIKKAKALKGQRGKDALASAEAEFNEKLKQMEARHLQELADAGPADVSIEPALDDAAVADIASTSTPTIPLTQSQEANTNSQELERLKKLEKARRKRDAKKEKERQLRDKEALEQESVGPSMRDTELQALELQLRPLSLRVVEIPSDGNCLYRAVAAQCGSDYNKIRQICADQLQSHQDEYAPFCEYTDSVSSFDQYVDRVRSSSDWGGHLELRALSEGLKRPIVVYCASKTKLVLGEDYYTSDVHHENDVTAAAGGDEHAPILLSYHLHYYTLGEHYNQVVPEATAAAADELQNSYQHD